MSVPTAQPAAPVRPFQIEVADEALGDLRRRIAATRWPEWETVADASQGVPLTTLEELARYWGPTTTGARARTA